MKGVLQRWMMTSLTGVALVAVAGVASAVDTSDADRTFRNYTRETATVARDEIRLEVRGLAVQDEENTRLNTYGLLQVPKHSVDSVHGGVVDLLMSYGFAKNAEVGLDVPGYIEEKHFTCSNPPCTAATIGTGGRTVNNSDIGDVQLYTKFQHSVATHCTAGGGVELSLPNGPVDKGFGTGELGVNPFISTRYQRGAFAVGTNVGYQLYTGEVKDVFNYGVEAVVRASETFALRAEVAGRVFNQAGQRFHDAVLLPGIDYNLSDSITIRPTGLANLTKTALDYGVGIGVAMKFTAPSMPQAAPPPPAVAQAPPPPPPPTKEKIILRGVHFDFDKATIRDDAKPVLDQAAETLKQHSAIAVTVEGHTDSRGTDEYNQRLSVRRAAAVRDYLVSHGIASSRLSVEGLGESRPVATNDTEDGRAQNRRVELQVAE